MNKYNQYIFSNLIDKPYKIQPRTNTPQLISFLFLNL
ncbi:hypothetical protein pb186bvf_005005 [Paramecium bursaria]